MGKVLRINMMKRFEEKEYIESARINKHKGLFTNYFSGQRGGGGGAVSKMLTMADKGGRGVRQMLSLADKGVAGSGYYIYH